MSARTRSLLCAAWVALTLAGCASNRPPRASPGGPASVVAPDGNPIAPQTALEKIVVGRSTKADVSEALGRAIVVPFDSGYEVWVYRWPGAGKTTRAATELVVLFDRQGVATKVRLRPGYAMPN